MRRFVREILEPFWYKTREFLTAGWSIFSVRRVRRTVFQSLWIRIRQFFVGSRLAWAIVIPVALMVPAVTLLITQDEIRQTSVGALKAEDIPASETTHTPGPSDKDWAPDANSQGCASISGFENGTGAYSSDSLKILQSNQNPPNPTWPKCVTGVVWSVNDNGTPTDSSDDYDEVKVDYKYVEVREEIETEYKYEIENFKPDYMEQHFDDDHGYNYNIINRTVRTCDTPNVFPCYHTDGRSTFWLKGTADIVRTVTKVNIEKYTKTTTVSRTIGVLRDTDKTVKEDVSSTPIESISQPILSLGTTGDQKTFTGVKYRGAAGCQNYDRETGPHEWMLEGTHGLSRLKGDGVEYLYTGFLKILTGYNTDIYQDFWGALYIEASNIPKPYISVESDVLPAGTAENVVLYNATYVTDRFIINNGDGAEGGSDENKFGYGNNPNEIYLHTVNIGPLDTLLADKGTVSVQKVKPTGSTTREFLFSVKPSIRNRFLGVTYCLSNNSGSGGNSTCDADQYYNVYIGANGMKTTKLGFNSNGVLTSPQGSPIDVSIPTHNSDDSGNYLMPGYYYVLSWTTLNEEGTALTETDTSQNPSPMNPTGEDEKFVVKWQPYLTSNATYNETTGKITDVLTPHAAGSLDDANNAVSAPSASGAKDKLWAEKVIDNQAFNRKVTACAYLYGPYNKPQANINQSGSSLAGNIPDNGRPGTGAQPIGGEKCETFGGEFARELDDAKGTTKVVPSAKTVEWDDSVLDGPGYYYIVTKIVKSDQTDGKDLIFGDWTSEFAPTSETEVFISRMTVTGVSKVQDGSVIVNDGNQNIYDKFTITTDVKYGEKWLYDWDSKLVKAKLCAKVSKLDKPYQWPQRFDVSTNLLPTSSDPPPADEKCQDITGIGEYTFDFGPSSLYQPGYYYFTHSIKGDNTYMKNTSEDRFLTTEYFIRQFQPYAVSDVVDGDGNNMKYNSPIANQNIRDTLDYKVADSLAQANDYQAKDNTHWLKADEDTYEEVQFCVTAYGPYQQPQARIDQQTAGAGDTKGDLKGIPNSYESSNKKATICHTAKGPEDTTPAEPGDEVYDFNTNGWLPGYYYFVTTVNKVNNFFNNFLVGSPAGQNQGVSGGNAISGLNLGVSDLIVGNWISEFNPTNEDEWGFVQFQPFVTSSAAVAWVDDPNNQSNPTISDTLTAHAAKNLQEANDGFQSGEDKTEYWSKDKNGSYETAIFCVTVYGPYQQAQADTSYSGSPTDTSYSVPNDPNGLARQAGDVKCGSFSGPETSQTFTWDTTGWTPGYYYFMSYFLKDNPTAMTNPPGLQGNDSRPIFIGNWTSQFNPAAEREAVADKFQLKAASKTRTSDTGSNPTTINTNIPADTGGHAGDQPDGVVDEKDSGSAVPVLKPTDTYIEDSIYIRAYDTNSQTDTSDDEKYWLKDLKGDYISFYACATVYGPYQQPQGNTSSQTQRIPAVGIGQVTQPTIPKNYNDRNDYITHCFWTDSAGDSNAIEGLASSPTYSDGTKTHGGPGEYKVRWSNIGDNYFQPGYYYIVWNIKKDARSDNDNTNGSGCSTSGGNSNTHCTTVDMGSGRVTQENGDFLVSDWYSPFGEQSESFYSQFQPIAKSTIPEFTTDDSTDNESGRTKSTGNEGIIMECDENKYTNTVNYSDNPEEYPHEKLHCHNVVDNIYLGAVNNNAIKGTDYTSVYANTSDYFWPKNKDGMWEMLKFQVKLYGPFKDAAFPKNPADSAVGLAGSYQISTVPANVYAAQGVYKQPIAESCVITTSASPTTGGPNWDSTPDPISVIFTQDFSSCKGSGTPSNTTIKLPPGIYTSIVEIVRDDEDKWGLDDDENCKQNNNCKINGVSTQDLPMHNMIIKDRFTSVWGDPKETLMVPLPLYIFTRRDNSAQDTFIDQVTIDDQYWVHGFDAQYVDTTGDRVPWKDIFGANIPKYGEYDGDAGYFNADVKNQAITVELYGAYPLADGRPNENQEYCQADRLVKNGRWILPAEDTGESGESLPWPSPLTLYEKGWYVYQYTFDGGERISSIKTQCGDSHEMFRIIKDEIGLVTSAYADKPIAPTRITDKVVVTGNFTDDDKNSIVKLSLYKSAHDKDVRPGLGELDGAPLCTIIFTVSAAGTYDTTKYIDADGHVENDTLGTGRCYAAEGGHYYWIEEFLRPGSNPLNPTETDYIQPIGTGKAPEDIDILPPTIPKVTTDADPATSVNQPFRDIALVEDIPEGNTQPYYLYFTAYGPFLDGTINCKDNLIYSNQSSPITVINNGEYYSDYITVSSNGLVYWVEHLLDAEGTVIDEGVCGVQRETTYVIGQPITPNVYEPFSVTPLYPDAGYLARQISKIVALGMMSILGAWQLSSKKSWLLRKR